MDYTWPTWHPNSPYYDEMEDGFMSNIQERICELLKSTKRNGIDNLINYMEESDFFTAPCSTQYHLSCEGGLAEHSLNVYRVMEYVSQGCADTCMMIPENMDEVYEKNSQKIVSLLHDIGKAKYRGKENYIPNLLKSGKISDSKPYITNENRLYIPHEVVSVIIASQFIELTEEEEFAILYHNGMYVPSGRDINGKERPLQLLLHFADMWCSRFIEIRKEE